jgi:hypothetical protein
MFHFLWKVQNTKKKAHNINNYIIEEKRKRGKEKKKVNVIILKNKKEFILCLRQGY